MTIECALILIVQSEVQMSLYCVPVTTVAGGRHLRSADSRCLVVPRTKTVLYFAVAGPLVWNSLPANNRSVSVSLQTFAGRLKTYLFELP